MEYIEHYLETKSKGANLQSNILVAHGSNILINCSFGYSNAEKNIPIASTTRFKLASVTKQFIAVLILNLAQEGKLDLHTPIAEILRPNYKGWSQGRPQWANKLTLHHILTNCSGLPDYINLPEFQPLFKIPHTKEEILNLIFTQDLSNEPGEKYGYSNSGFVLLGEVIEEVTKQPYQNYLSDIILKPANLSSTEATTFQREEGVPTPILENKTYALGYLRSHSDPETLSVKGNAFPISPYAYQTTADGSLLSTAQDLHLWNLFLYTGQILNPLFLDKMLHPYVRVIQPRSIAMTNRKLSIHYGYGIARVFDPQRSTTYYRHAGISCGFRAELVYCPATKVTVVILSNATWEDQKSDPMRDIRKQAHELLCHVNSSI